MENALLEDESRKRISRRRVLTTLIAGGGAAALALALAARQVEPARAADGDALIIGRSNTGSSVTSLSGSPALIVVDSPDTGGLQVQNTNLGQAQDPFLGAPIAIWGRSTGTSNLPAHHHRGVLGTVESRDGVGVEGISDFNGPGFGVRGYIPSAVGGGVGVIGLVADSPSGVGVRGLVITPSWPTIGVSGDVSSPNGRAVVGVNNSPTGFVSNDALNRTAGVVGSSMADNSTGVIGVNNSPNGFVSNDALNRTAGVLGSTLADNSTGVIGLNTSPNSFVSNDALNRTAGVGGYCASPNGTGVAGVITAQDGLGFVYHDATNRAAGTRGHVSIPGSDGVRGVALSVLGGTGVHGVELNRKAQKEKVGDQEAGVVGESFGAAGIGVSGRAPNTIGPNVGVAGTTDSTTVGTAVIGQAGAASGNSVGVHGQTLSPDGSAVLASNIDSSGAPNNGIGLAVIGRIETDSIIDGTIPRHASSVTISDRRINPNSHVLAELTGDPGTLGLPGGLSTVKNSIAYVAVLEGSFTINLMNKADVQVPFRAFISRKASLAVTPA